MDRVEMVNFPQLPAPGINCNDNNIIITRAMRNMLFMRFFFTTF